MLMVHIWGIPWGICMSTQRERSREKERLFPGGLFEGCSWLQLFAWWHVRCAVPRKPARWYNGLDARYPLVQRNGCMQWVGNTIRQHSNADR